jgi:hypothetical protein
MLDKTMCCNHGMAQRTVTVLIDDTSGEEIPSGKGETVSFSLDDQAYAIDLTTKNADAFRKLFADYIAVASKVGRKRGGRGARRSSSTSSAEVRAWARENGWPKLGDRGRIPADVQAAYDAR